MKYSKQCPTCGKEISYTTKQSLLNSQKLNRSCRSCSCGGRKNPFFGKKHTIDTKNKIKTKIKEFYSDRKNPMSGRSVYQVWTEKYGKEEADIRMNNLKEKQRINATGERNPMYGKPSPKGSGNGWSGWYKSWYFRSLRELSYVIEVIEPNNLIWKSAESIKIPYIDWDGSARTYSPDFIINNIKIIEIKPGRLKSSKSVILKKEAAEKFCNSIGWTYELIDHPRLSNEKIKLLHDSGEIKFIDRYEAKFLELNS